jgi:hypothetical protein
MLQFFRPELAKAVVQGCIVRARFARNGEHLVITAHGVAFE